MKNRRASCIECYPLGNDFVTTIARVVPSRTKRLLGVVGRVKYAAVILHRHLVLDTILRDLLHYLWRVGLVATSPIRWEAYLLWMSHDPVSPIWGCSMYSQIIGKLGYCTPAKLGTPELHFWAGSKQSKDHLKAMLEATTNVKVHSSFESCKRLFRSSSGMAKPAHPVKKKKPVNNRAP